MFSLKKLRAFRFLLISIFLIGVIIDIFSKANSDISLLLLCALWILAIKLFKLKSAMTFKVTFVFLATLFFLFLISPDQKSIERVATWIFLFLVLGIVQQFREVAS
ncbi:MAG: hypothetical protein HYV37_02510 [Candidatus Levyibacteriota bacterium]|nr:MAG: hypothetical protein HYV37_02510 [Candidatus Levybacteria bacterium]